MIPSTVTSNVEFVSKMLTNFVNDVTSFVQNIPGTSERIVPSSIIQTWYVNFQRSYYRRSQFLETKLIFHYPSTLKKH